MKTTIIKLSRNELVLNRIELKDLAETIRKSPDGKMEDQVAVLRRNYRFYKAVRLEDGQIKLDSDRYVALPRICFAVEFDK